MLDSIVMGMMRPEAKTPFFAGSKHAVSMNAYYGMLQLACMHMQGTHKRDTSMASSLDAHGETRCDEQSHVQ